MTFWARVLSLLLLVSSAHGGGFPVVDTNELLKQTTDALYLLSSIDTLLTELGGNTSDVQSILSLTREIEAYERDIRRFEELGGAIDDASVYSPDRSKVFADQVHGLSRHIRKLKTVLTLAKTVGARPEAVTASMEILKDERMREKERFEIALKALEEKEKISALRRRLTRKVELRRAIREELNEINGFTRDKTVKPVDIKETRGSQELKSLW